MMSLVRKTVSGTSTTKKLSSKGEQLQAKYADNDDESTAHTSFCSESSRSISVSSISASPTNVEHSKVLPSAGVSSMIPPSVCENNSLQDDGDNNNSKYGYGDAAPDSALSEDKYGYGDAAPDSAAEYRRPSKFELEEHEDAIVDKYGYGDAAPDSAVSEDKYGYVDAAPDSATEYRRPSKSYELEEYQDALVDNDADKYGYGDAAPDNKQQEELGYESGNSSDGGLTVASDSNLYNMRRESVAQRARRRRNGGDGSGRRESVRRHSNESLRLGKGPTPRRSSMKQAGAPRRKSIDFTGERTIRLPNSNRKVKRRTSITFDDEVRVKKVQPVASLTNNPEKLWFQDEEFENIKEKVFTIVDLVESGELPPDKERKLCMRGLESLLEKNRQNKEELRYQAWDSVLDEQDHQMHNGTFNEKSMADQYKLTAMQSRIEAQKRAKQDQDEVERYLKNTRRACRRFSCQ